MEIVIIMYKIGICGHYGGNETFLDGQTVKTKTITKELQKIYGNDKIILIDTYHGKKKIVSLIFSLFKLVATCSNVIILPAHNSLRLFAPILVTFNFIFHRRLHYIVIGGWLPDFIQHKKILRSSLKNFCCIYVETKSMKKKLEDDGYNNVYLLPNCKDIKILDESELVYSFSEPYRLCTFSRVNKQKGIEDAIKAICFINNHSGRIVFTLDIYGQISDDYRVEFKSIIENSPDYISYKGSVDYNKSVDVLKNYYALIFPTHFFTEGIPGTIIDAFSSGVPVISSKWENFDDIIRDSITGYGYEFLNGKELIDILFFIQKHPDQLVKMKKNCLCKAQDFNSYNVIKAKLIENLDSDNACVCGGGID